MCSSQLLGGLQLVASRTEAEHASAKAYW